MIASLTNELTGPRNFPLSQECAVIVLSRCIWAINRLPMRTIEETAARREASTELASILLDIQRQLLAEVEREKLALDTTPSMSMKKACWIVSASNRHKFRHVYFPVQDRPGRLWVGIEIRAADKPSLRPAVSTLTRTT
jgi:hypothetical protein